MPLSVYAIDSTGQLIGRSGSPMGMASTFVVQPNGSRIWRYRYRFAGIEKLLALGSCPATSLADARRKREEARKLIEAGTDPVVQRKRDRLAATKAARTTFGLIAEENLENLAAVGAAAITIEKHRWLLTTVAALGHTGGSRSKVQRI